MELEDRMALGAPRKTLDEIRHEIEAEFAGTPIADAAAGEADVKRRSPRRDVVKYHVDDDLRLEELRRHRARSRTRRGKYILAGVIGCVVGQLALFGSVAATRHWFRFVHILAVVPPSPVRTMLASQSTPQPSGPTAAWHAADIERTPAPTPSVAVELSPPAAAAPEPPAMPVPPLTMGPPPPGAAEPPMHVMASQHRTVSTARVAVATPTPELRTPVAEFDWAESQAEVRAALGAWLALSGREADSLASDAVVILGADGQTAKTHVPIRSRSGVLTMSEQHWGRTTKGWGIVAEREKARER
jgi:hypothetical protein